MRPAPGRAAMRRMRILTGHCGNACACFRQIAIRKTVQRRRRRGNASSAGRQLATHHGETNLAGVFSFRVGAFWPGAHHRMILAGKRFWQRAPAGTSAGKPQRTGPFGKLGRPRQGGSAAAFACIITPPLRHLRGSHLLRVVGAVWRGGALPRLGLAFAQIGPQRLRQPFLSFRRCFAAHGPPRR